MSSGSASPLSLSGKEELRAALQQATLGRYEIHQELGSGGMATVFLARDLALDRPVALKVMLPALLLNEGMADRFRREARTAASLNHPQIIPIYAVGEEGRLLYFVMKYVSGRPLDEILREIGQVPVEMVAAILSQVGSALGYAHRKGVVHRDIKPANIMIDDEGWAVVTDFGIAKTSEATHLTSTGASVGTPYYMSPEQFAGTQVGPHSDQYSLGVVAYEMLTGKVPFPGRSLADLVRAHFVETPVPVSQLRSDCPPAVCSLVMRMLAREPAERWPSMEAVVAQLRRGPETGADDPVRTQMVTLARSGPRRVELPRSPTSPIPKGRPHGPREPRITEPLTRSPRLTRSPAARLLLGTALAGLALAAALRPWRREIGAAPSESIDPGPKAVSAAPDSMAAAGLDLQPVTEPPGEKREAILPPIGREPEVSRRTRDAVRPAPDRPDSTAAVPAELPSPTRANQAWVLLGSRHEAAVVYIDGSPRLPKAPSLRWWEVPLGEVTIEVRAEGCRAFRATRVFGAGDSLRIGYRHPSCGAPADSVAKDSVP